jgi:hypothetical protein
MWAAGVAALWADNLRSNRWLQTQSRNGCHAQSALNFRMFPAGKKRGSTLGVEPLTQAEAKIESDGSGEGGGYAICRLGPRRGRRIRRIPGVA